MRGAQAFSRSILHSGTPEQLEFVDPALNGFAQIFKRIVDQLCIESDTIKGTPKVIAFGVPRVSI